MHYRSGTIAMQGSQAYGISASSVSGVAQVITDSGTTINVTSSGLIYPGIAAETSGTAAQSAAVTMQVASNINMSGAAAPNTGWTNNPVGIRGISRADAPVNITYTGPGITTAGGGGDGILALSDTGSVAVNATGPITTTGLRAFGILTDSGNGVLGSIPGQGGSVAVAASGPISTTGNEAHGIWANSTTGTVQVSASQVSATGEYSVGIKAKGGGDVTVNIAQGGSIMGGWQPDVSSVGPVYGFPSAGMVFGSANGIAILNNAGMIGSLSDRAVVSIDLFRAAAGSMDPQINNTGIIDGFITLGGSNNSLVNDGTFNLRHFADTSGDGVRDTVRVAVADLGIGSNNTFSNNGTLALAEVSGATAIDTTGQYLPQGNANNAMSLGGTVQGQLLGVTIFTNSGVIDLMTNAATGNVLTITGGRLAGTPGSGTFISNGGLLMVNTVLNEGGAATRSDTLVVDGTAVGVNGATKIAVHNTGGAGAMTVGDGILVVQVLDSTRSAANAFSLNGRAVAGVYEYELFHGGISPDGNWYLRSDLSPVAPPGPPEEPLYRPEVPAYLSNRQMAGQMFIHSLHDRLGEPQYREGQGFNPDEDKSPSVWLRLVGMTGGSDSADHNFTVTTDSFLLHGGAELGKWNVFSESKDRNHIGLMAAYGESNSNTRAQDNPFRAQGLVDGLILGIYDTWYRNDENKLGTYVDTWFQYGWFNNTVKGDELPDVNYNAQGWAVSGELGYAKPLDNDWVIEPQAQLIYRAYTQNDLTEPSGTFVSGADSNELVSRLGLRLHRTYIRDEDHKFQPYVTVNWWHFSNNGSMSFDSLPMNGLYPVDRYELKLGLNASFGKDWTGWAIASGAWGEQNYHLYALRLGAMYTW
ncbi:MAG: autotransporter outer membrane beta-barrel domain-containing protein [Desulfocapsaceae bacterium]|nr:autotransporter outer membrane beta-barrel domain-containing protein [Desulfocapsaceae bacterium]